MTMITILHELTEKLYNHIQKPLPSGDDERERYLAMIDVYLEKREKRMNAADQPGEAVKGDREALEIVRMNEVIQERMTEIKNLIGQDLHQARMQKSIQTRYERADQGVVGEGYYFDRKN
ncbi:hypothetical protein [Geomicrobium sp. JCM 19039]|uniref:hypothetical protein n=1 Tax=Geomicrobium sp. JCM 19039 TaxID=1460636 RepID=UPI00045F18CC|nr:hypothetical protein [Geomicrobium sp. JCM 19039]GAK11646.1 hypothetical protein JCM19039_1353 [Geomicrobium sp. JCM 19039]